MGRLKFTIEELAQDPWYGELIRILEDRFGRPLPDKLTEFLTDQAEWRNVGPSQILNWIEDLGAIMSRMIGAQIHSSDLALFWIRLHALITELEEYFGPNTNLGGYINKYAEDMHVEIVRIIDQITRDEVLWIEYERTCQCHPKPGYYRKRLNLKKNGELALKNTHADLSLEDWTQQIAIARARYSGDASLFALSLCQRIYGPVVQLVMTAKAWSVNL